MKRTSFPLAAVAALLMASAAHAGQPADAARFSIMAPVQAAYDAYQATASRTQNTMDSIEADPRLRLSSTDGAFMYIGFNGKAPPFDDHRVRQAVAFAVKRDDIVKSVFFGRGGALGACPS